MLREELITIDKTDAVIEKIKQKTIIRKRNVLSNLIAVLNEVCDKNAIRYFAIGKLLSFCINSDMDSFLGQSRFHIGMLRKEYILFQNLFLLFSQHFS